MDGIQKYSVDLGVFKLFALYSLVVSVGSFC